MLGILCVTPDGEEHLEQLIFSPVLDSASRCLFAAPDSRLRLRIIRMRMRSVCGRIARMSERDRPGSINYRDQGII